MFTRRMGSSPINRTNFFILKLNSLYADMAESADALVSGTSDGDIVEVQVLLSAPFFYMRSWRNWQTRYFEGVVFTRRMGSSPIDRTIGKIKAQNLI